MSDQPESSTPSTAGTADPIYDLVVIGAGPAGAAAATLVAQGGHRVLLLERERRPGFKVGESLLPGSFETLERLGVLEALRASHFPKKYSVQFYSGSGRASVPFYFSETEDSQHTQTWQVLRSEFEELLLDNARRHGVEIRSGVAVQEVLFDGERAVGVRLRDGDGAVREVASRVVVDATGQRALLARQLGIRRLDPCLRMAAVFTHFEGAQRDTGLDEGATLILHNEDHTAWFWFIPLPEDRVSVGVVGPVDDLIKDREGGPQRIFDEELARCPGLLPRLENARQAMDVRVLKDFSYAATRAAGDGWVLVGDAYTFLDPIYSSGVFLALASAELAADAILGALASSDVSARRLGAFEPHLRRGIQAFRQLVYAFYTPSFNFGRFLRHHPEHRDAIIKILVGDVFDRDFTALFRDVHRFKQAAAASTAEVTPGPVEPVLPHPATVADPLLSV